MVSELVLIRPVYNKPLGVDSGAITGKALSGKFWWAISWRKGPGKLQGIRAVPPLK